MKCRYWAHYFWSQINTTSNAMLGLYIYNFRNDRLLLLPAHHTDQDLTE